MVEITYEETQSNIDEILRYAQLISDAFSKALDQNECNLKIVVGLSQEITDRKRDVEDLWEIMNPVVYVPDSINKATDGNVVYKIPLTTAGQAAVELNRAAIKKYLQVLCKDCGLGWPKVDFDSSFNFSMQNLRDSLDAYLAALGLKNPNLCHSASMFSEACLGDLLKLISLLLGVYSGILAIRKLSSISLSAFVKGVISGLLQQLIGNLSIRVDMSQTGLACIVTAFKEYSTSLFQNNKIEIEDTEELLEYLGYTEETTTAALIESMRSYIESSEGLFNSYINKLETQQKSVEKGVSDSVGYVTDTLNNAIEWVTEETGNIFGLLDYFQCEFSRTGSDFTGIASFISRITNVINLISALITVVSKKQIKLLCKTKGSLGNLSSKDILDLSNTLTDLDATELIEEFMEKVVDITKDENDNISPLIYDKDKETILPKLNFYNCNLKEFIEAHKIENIIDSVVKQIIKETNEEEELNNPSLITNNNPNNNDGYFNNDGEWIYILPDFVNNFKPIDKGDNYNASPIPAINIIDKDKWKEYPVEFIKPEYIGKDITTISKKNLIEMANMTDYTTKSPQVVSREILKDSSGRIISINNGMKDILDFVYNNPLVSSNNNSTVILETDLKKESSTDYKENLKNTIDKLNKDSIIGSSPNINKSYENKCKDIGDVLNLLENIKGKQ